MIRGGLAFMNAFMIGIHECRAPQGSLRTSVQLDFLLRAPAARAIECMASSTPGKPNDSNSARWDGSKVAILPGVKWTIE